MGLLRVVLLLGGGGLIKDKRCRIVRLPLTQVSMAHSRRLKYKLIHTSSTMSRKQGIIASSEPRSWGNPNASTTPPVFQYGDLLTFSRNSFFCSLQFGPVKATSKKPASLSNHRVHGFLLLSFASSTSATYVAISSILSLGTK